MGIPRQGARDHRLVSDQDHPIRMRCVLGQLRIWAILSGNDLLGPKKESGMAITKLSTARDTRENARTDAAPAFPRRCRARRGLDRSRPRIPACSGPCRCPRRARQEAAAAVSRQAKIQQHRLREAEMQIAVWARRKLEDGRWRVVRNSKTVNAGMLAWLGAGSRLYAGQIHPSRVCTARYGYAGQARASR
jgi:hypothetical protein